MSPVLSVVIPAYNVGPYLADAIESVQQQTIKDLEIIVINDGSTDNTQGIAENFLNDSRVILVNQENLGLCVARNKGISRSKGKYIGFLDADDRWNPRKAECHLEVFHEHPEIDLSLSWWKIVDERGRYTGKKGTPQKRKIEIEDLILENFFGPTSSVIIRREAIKKAGNFDVNLQAAVDLDLWLRIVQLREKNVWIIPELLVDWRLRPGQITKDWKRMARNWDKVIEKVRNEHPERVRSVEKEARYRQDRYYAHLAYNADDFPGAAKCFLRAFSVRPIKVITDFNNWKALARVSARMFGVKLDSFAIEKN